MLKTWMMIPLALLAMLAFAACGDDDDDGGDDGTRTATATRDSADADSDGDDEDDPDATGDADETGDAGNEDGDAGDEGNDGNGSGGDGDGGGNGDGSDGNGNDGGSGDGGGDDDEDEEPTPSPTPNARVCLVTVQEVTQAIGESVELRSSDDGCTFQTETFETVDVSTSSLGENPEEAFNTGFELVGGERVDGIGDEAFWLSGFDQLNVRQGDQHLIVTLILADNPNVREAGTEIAAAALTRI